MNKAITSFWKRLFFRYDVSRMRKAVVDYLTAEGIQAEVKDGMIQVLFEDHYYNVEFENSPDITLNDKTCSGKLFLSNNLDSVMVSISHLSSTKYERKNNIIHISKKDMPMR